VSKIALSGGYYQQKAPHRKNGRGILVKPYYAYEMQI